MQEVQSEQVVPNENSLLNQYDEEEGEESDRGSDENFSGESNSGISKSSKVISKSSKAYSNQAAAIRKRHSRQLKIVEKQEATTDVLLKLAKSQIVTTKQLTADVRNLLFKVFEEGYKKMRSETKADFKKQLFTKPLIEAKTHQL